MNFWERYNDCVGKNTNINKGNSDCSRDGNCSANANNASGRGNANNASGKVNNGSSGQNANSQGGRNAYSEQDVRRKFDEYSGKNEGELMGELASTVARMKSEGTFDAQSIENMYNTAAPFLNDMQRQRMREIIDTLVK